MKFEVGEIAIVIWSSDGIGIGEEVEIIGPGKFYGDCLRVLFRDGCGGDFQPKYLRRRRNVMTEDQAKKKRCGGPPGCGTTKNPENGMSVNLNFPQAQRWCIASDCMTWQWETFLEIGPGASAIKTTSDKNGYCGLASK